MEAIYKNVSFAAPSACAFSQAGIESDIPVIEGHIVDKILLSTGHADIIKYTVEDGLIDVDGKIVISIIALDGKDVFSFNSTAEFTHSIPLDSAQKGAKASLKAELSALDITVAGDTLGLRCAIDISARVFSRSSVDMLTGVKGCDTQLKEVTLRQRRRVLLEKRDVTIHDEIVMSDLKSILMSEGNMTVSMALNNSGVVTISGVTNISALAKKLDSSLSRINQSLPFSTDVEVKADCEVCAELVTDCIRLRPMGGDFGLISVEAVGTIFVYAQENDEIKFTLDAYSVSEPFIVKSVEIKSSTLASSVNESVTMRESLTLKDGMSDIFSIIYATVRPIPTAVSEEDGRLVVHGISFLSCIYADETGALESFSDELPFAVSTNEAYSADADIRVSACRTVLSGAMKTIDVKYLLNINGEIYREESVLVANGIESSEPKPAKHGVSMYFLAEGEDAFAVGKRFNVEIGEVKLCEDGKRAIVIR